MRPTYRNMTYAYMDWYTTLGNTNTTYGTYQGRSCLGGYQTGSSYWNTDKEVKDSIRSSTLDNEFADTTRRHLYRNNSEDSSFRGYVSEDDTRNWVQPASLNYNAVIKGIPLSSQLIPCPYYLPDDFVLINFDHASPGQNIQQNDTITISEGSEVYTVIDGAYNQTTRTRGILLAARTT